MEVPLYEPEPGSLTELRLMVVARGEDILYNLHQGCLYHRVQAMASLLVVEWTEGDLIRAMLTGEVPSE